MVDYRFPRGLRLLTPEDFKHVFAEPVRAPLPHLTALARSSSRDHSRLGLAVPKKHVKLAVQRNRIKRLIRESYRQHQHKLPNLDIVIIAKAGIADLSNEEICQWMDKLWRKLSRRCNG